MVYLLCRPAGGALVLAQVPPNGNIVTLRFYDLASVDIIACFVSQSPGVRTFISNSRTALFTGKRNGF